MCPACQPPPIPDRKLNHDTLAMARVFQHTASSFHVDRGWSMKLGSILPIVLFALALTGVVRANDQQTQQACVNAAICLLAVRSGVSSDRRSDLQARYTSFAFRECHGLVGLESVCRGVF